MANYKYNYNEEPAPPPKDAQPYKYYSVYPNNVLVMGILSLIFSGWLGIVFALYALQKEKIYRAEHDGETCTKVKIGKILSVTSLALAGAAVVIAVIYYAVMLIILAMQEPQEASQLFAYFYSFI